jgi:hypothetical protein
MRANQKPKPKAIIDKERKALEEERRIQRELRLQKRIAALTRQLSRSTYHAQTRVFQLGRELVMDQGWSVVKMDALALLEAELARLRDRVMELEAENVRVGNEGYELRKSNEDLREAVRAMEAGIGVSAGG